MATDTPAGVLDRRRDLILSGDVDGYAELFAPDAVIEAPFGGLPGMPVRLEGREAVRAYARQVLTSPLRLDNYDVVELHQTQDPEVVVAEMRAEATVTTTGRSFAATSIHVLRIRDGRIAHVREYSDPRGLDDVIGDRRAGG